MGMSIKTNISSLEAQKNLMNTENALDSSLGKLSSGFRITKASDDAAGLAISVNLGAQIASYGQAIRNANDALNVIQTAESSMNESQNIITRLRELASEAASSGIGNTERGYIQNEVNALTSEIDRIANATEYNGVSLINSSIALTFQVGIRNVALNDQITVSTANATTAALGLNGLSFTTLTGAEAALSILDDAMQTISAARATMGAQSNRMQSVINTATTESVSLSAAQSRIRDVDVAEETSNLSRQQILMQAGVSVLAQANQVPQAALKLISG
ncbi:MAG TPA: flagellin [Polyangia bacterium]|nr:flagellin [Polyangia bacterium]